MITTNKEAQGPLSHLDAMTKALEETNRQLCEQIVINEALRRENAILWQDSARLKHELQVLRETLQ
jgi:hypothetical protein